MTGRFILTILLPICVSMVTGTDLDAVLRRLEDIESREKEYVSTIQSQGRRIAQVENDATQRDFIISELNRRIDYLVEQTQAANDVLQSDDNDVVQHMDKQDDNYDRFENMNDVQMPEGTKYVNRNRLQKSIKEGTIKRRFVVDPETPVAFHAVVDGRHEFSHYQINQTVVFPTELLNVGGGYHKQHGLFIAPMKGIYVFSASLLSYVGTHPEFYAGLVKNDVALARLYGHGDNGRHDQGSVTMTVQMEMGDEVWVKIEFLNDVSLWGARFCSFTGFMLMPL